MTLPEISIHAVVQGRRLLWQVRCGRRALNFQEELAARAFAAQLHLRLHWLQREAGQDGEPRR
ncbi:hypothetical protein I0D00_01465 [Pseudomonas lalucatii]|uniref:Uncharacterized protein n=1 Tax=Pseudomonas lalucatii TaxID=1424203 RepID=A0ABS5PVR6_9PSED|nr:hypothetical protein [Pseudomonas lalucatii]MBS7660620.1 hypothetical protein [Pseudomonas lalucatii]MBS7691331.1 hypothetical protein [Pseudomonas lalucatii]MBS7724546.1 hypothetical protein [Pseudomonas lalucatii]QVM88997.1 hypothetical protein I0D68_20430 [Pseudomonas lalucatii]